jgi:phage tail-like protein
MADGMMDPLVAAYYTVEAQGKVVGAFAKLEGGGSENTLVTYYSTNAQGRPAVTYEPGPIKVNPYTLSRGVTNDLSFFKWREMVEEGNMAEARVNCSIIGFKQDGTEVLRINLERAWVSKYEGMNFDAQTGNTLMEKVTLIYETAKRVK